MLRDTWRRGTAGVPGHASTHAWPGQTTLAGGGYEVQGLLTLREELDKETRRQSRVARLAGIDRFGQPAEMVLCDALLIHAAGRLWTMTGFERVDDGYTKPVTYLQSWALEAVTQATLDADDRLRRYAEESRQYSEVQRDFVGPLKPIARPHRRARR